VKEQHKIVANVHRVRPGCHRAFVVAQGNGSMTVHGWNVQQGLAPAFVNASQRDVLLSSLLEMNHLPKHLDPNIQADVMPPQGIGAELLVLAVS